MPRPDPALRCWSVGAVVVLVGLQRCSQSPDLCRKCIDLRVIVLLLRLQHRGVLLILLLEELRHIRRDRFEGLLAIQWHTAVHPEVFNRLPWVYLASLRCQSLPGCPVLLAGRGEST